MDILIQMAYVVSAALFIFGLMALYSGLRERADEASRFLLAFALPILHNITPGIGEVQALVVAPTRELAGQISDSLTTYGRFTGLRHTVIYGGVRQGPQVRALQAGVKSPLTT